ncbi:FeoA family protein [Myroides guanonis]|uniref:Ferrous iron transport protein A n=1 Tax=Myroides guanonis TaxID=1150112 RepID=A0A1I3T2G3_9FLAO|nr:FeoA family protein [Myroides guanonis]SFJ65125.1 ferrous iron transport protein A [Myroides guanonis]
MTITLNTLKKNQRAKILDFDLDQVPLKLLEMGCLPGNSVEILEVAPLGDPLLLCINDTHLSIRRELAKQIQVEIEK